MLQNKQLLYAVVLVGVILAALSFLIDPIRGIEFHMAGIQILALVIGIVLILAGGYLAFMRKPPAVR